MDDLSNLYDLYDLTTLFVISEEVGGTLALTQTGRLVIYGVDDVGLAVARINSGEFEFFVEALSDDILGVKQ